MSLFTLYFFLSLSRSRFGRDENGFKDSYGEFYPSKIPKAGRNRKFSLN